MLQEKDLKLYRKISEAITKFDKYGFNYKLNNPDIGEFIIQDSNNRIYQYIADTETIIGRKETGINDLIRILRGEL